MSSEAVILGAVIVTMLVFWALVVWAVGWTIRQKWRRWKFAQGVAKDVGDAPLVPDHEYYFRVETVNLSDATTPTEVVIDRSEHVIGLSVERGDDLKGHALIQGARRVEPEEELEPGTEKPS